MRRRSCGAETAREAGHAGVANRQTQDRRKRADSACKKAVWQDWGCPGSIAGAFWGPCWISVSGRFGDAFCLPQVHLRAAGSHGHSHGTRLSVDLQSSAEGVDKATPPHRSARQVRIHQLGALNAELLYCLIARLFQCSIASHCFSVPMFHCFIAPLLPCSIASLLDYSRLQRCFMLAQRRKRGKHRTARRALVAGGLAHWLPLCQK